MVRLQIAIGVIGILTLTGVVISKYSQMKPITEAETLAMASLDDPKLGTSTPELLKKTLKQTSELVVYLPECSGCTVMDPIPDPLPGYLNDAVFVKRSEKDIPASLASGRFVVDSNGDIQRKLNAYQLPRVYRFRGGKLEGFQRLNETWLGFLKKGEE